MAVDADGSPVTVSWSGDSRRNVIVWMDHRAVKQAEKINTCNSSVLQYCGGSISPEMEPPKVAVIFIIFISCCSVLHGQQICWNFAMLYHIFWSWFEDVCNDGCRWYTTGRLQPLWTGEVKAELMRTVQYSSKERTVSRGKDWEKGCILINQALRVAFTPK